MNAKMRLAAKRMTLYVRREETSVTWRIHGALLLALSLKSLCCRAVVKTGNYYM